MFFTADGQSDTGRVRDHNEDTFRVASKQGLFAVADGMGGHAAGEVASALAIEALFSHLLAEESESLECSAEALQQAVSVANRAIFSDAQEHEERKGMGTTLTFICCAETGGYLGHVGDSRAYRLRGEVLTQLTRDHTWVNMQVRAGVISQEEAANARMRHVLVKALGIEPEIEADVIPIDVMPHDRFLLCSDGLSDLVDEDGLKSVLAAKGPPAETAARLVELANALGGKDNITAVVIDCHEARCKSTLMTAVNKLRR